MNEGERGLTNCCSYHLGLKPGQAVLDSIGGAHKLQGWNHNILTDSGGLVPYLSDMGKQALTFPS